MRRRSLRLAPIVMAWLTLAPLAGRAQDEWYRPGDLPSPTPNSFTARLRDDLPSYRTAKAPAMTMEPTYRGQDDATGYALPDPNLPSPLGGPRADGVYFYGSFVMYAQTMPLKHQVIAKRGILDILGEISGVPNNPIGLQREALETDQVMGPQTQQPGFKIGLGYRFADGAAIEASWLHLNTASYRAVATPIPVDFKLRPDLADSFLFAPVSNFPLDFAGPFLDTSLGPAFGIWNGADVMTIEYTQRNEIYELVYRTPPIVDTLEWRTYGILGARAIWFYEKFRWRTIDLDINGQSASIWEAVYNNIVSNRLYGVKIGCGNDWYLGNGFSCNTELFVTPMANFVQKISKYERGDRNIGPENKRADRDYTFVPELGATVAMNWFPYEGIQVKASYNFMAYFNTVTSERPVSFDYSALVPEYDRLFFRHLRGLEIGVMIRF